MSDVQKTLLARGIDLADPRVVAKIDELLGENKFQEAAPARPRKTPPRKRTVTVACDAGETLERALQKSADELEVVFTGSCAETVLIRRDSVTLRGLDASSEILGSLTVEQSRGVVLRDLMVRDSAVRGVVISQGSYVTLENVTSTGHAFQGLFIDQSGALANGLVMNNNATEGIGVVRGSALTATGSIQANNNGTNGIVISDSSSFVAASFDLESNDNADFGTVVQMTSSATMFAGFFRGNGNRLGGLLVAGVSVFFEGATFFEARGNDEAGVGVSDLSAWLTVIPFGAQRVLVDNGLYGLRAESGSYVDLTGANASTTVMNNGMIGFVLLNATARFTGLELLGHDLDMRVDFGGKALFFGDGNTVGSIDCAAGSYIGNQAFLNGDEGFETTLCPVVSSGDFFIKANPKASQGETPTRFGGVQILGPPVERMK